MGTFDLCSCIKFIIAFVGLFSQNEIDPYPLHVDNGANGVFKTKFLLQWGTVVE